MNPHLDQVGDLVKSVKGDKQLLANLVQQGHVPHDIALLAGMRIDRLKAPQGNPNQPTVLQKEFAPQAQMPVQGLAQLAQPQAPQAQIPQQPSEQGLPGLATGGMFDEANYAGGGIVAFNDGGDVQHFQEGGRPNVYTGGQDINAMVIQGYKDALPGIINKVRSGGTLSEGEQKVINTLRNAGQLSTGFFGAELPSTPQTVQPAPATITGKPTAPASTPPAAPTISTDKPATKTRPDMPVEAPHSVTTESRTPGGVASLYTAPADLTTRFDSLLRPEVTAEQEMARYKSLIGEDKNAVAMRDRLAAMEAKAAKEEERAPWLALAKAGFGMAAGQSQYALQNLGAGAMEGIKEYGAYKERAEKAEERRFDIANRLAQAERAEQVAAATFGEHSAEATRAKNETTKLAQLNYNAERANNIANKEFDAKKFQLELAQKDREINVMASKVDKQIASAETQSKRYELQNARDAIKATLSNITDLLKVETNPANQAQLYKAFNDNVLKLNNLATYGSVGGASNPAAGKLPPAVENAMKLYNK